MMPSWIRRENLTAGLIAAVITAAGNFIAFNLGDIIEWVKGPSDAPVIEAPIATTRMFGEWVELEANTVYKTESDGFVAAYTGGDNPANYITIDVGRTPDQLSVRTRALRYDGSVTPVARNYYWRVRPHDSTKTVVVWWLPITLVGKSG